MLKVGLRRKNVCCAFLCSDCRYFGFFVMIATPMKLSCTCSASALKVISNIIEVSLPDVKRSSKLTNPAGDFSLFLAKLGTVPNVQAT